MNNKSAVLLISLLALLVSPFATADAFKPVQNFNLDYVFVKEGASFDNYDAVYIDPISVWYPTRETASEEEKQAGQANLARAQEMFHRLIRLEIKDEHRIALQPGERTLRVHAEFVDLRTIPPGGEIPAYFNSKKFRTAPGHITLVAELSNSASGEVLARVADLGQRSSSGNYRDVDWAAIESDLHNWAQIFGEWFNSTHSHEAQSPVSHSQ